MSKQESTKSVAAKDEQPQELTNNEQGLQARVTMTKQEEEKIKKTLAKQREDYDYLLKKQHVTVVCLKNKHLIEGEELTIPSALAIELLIGGKVVLKEAIKAD